MINRDRLENVRRTGFGLTAALLVGSLFVGAAAVPGYTTMTPLTSITVASVTAPSSTLTA